MAVKRVERLIYKPTREETADVPVQARARKPKRVLNEELVRSGGGQEPGEGAAGPVR